MLKIIDKYSNKTSGNNHGQILKQNICLQSLTNTQTKHMLKIIDKYSNKTNVNNHGQILKQNIC